ncbi:MAG: hypothetical protein ACYCTE_13750 [Acidimicrobiales bacterium]
MPRQLGVLQAGGSTVSSARSAMDAHLGLQQRSRPRAGTEDHVPSARKVRLLLGEHSESGVRKALDRLVEQGTVSMHRLDAPRHWASAAT